MTEWLTKSKLISAYQCPKRLWVETHEAHLAAEGNSSEALFRMGREVGEVARTLFPGGQLIGHIRDPERAARDTQELIAKPGPLTLYEAAFVTDRALTRIDIFQRDELGHSRLVEVKASASVKDVHLLDSTIQAGILRQAGIQLEQVVLAHIDTSFVYQGDGDYQGLLTEQDLTDQIGDLLAQVPGWINESKLILQSERPEVLPGKQCTSPYPCPFFDVCNEQGPEYPISILPGKRAVKSQLLEDGYEDIRQIPEGYLADRRAEWMRAVTASGKPEVKPEAADILGDLPFPRYYLDFETAAPAVPIWAGTRPFEALPFQWSCHVEQQGGEITHQEYLAPDTEPPMRGCAETLLAALGTAGPIFTYSSYEKTVIKKLSARFPDLEADLLALLPRLVDLFPITKQHYYHPQLKGSWSIKTVLPTITADAGYAQLTGIKEGLGASEGYLEMIGPETTPERKAQLRSELLEYCRLDTFAMVKLAHFLANKDEVDPGV